MHNKVVLTLTINALERSMLRHVPKKCVSLFIYYTSCVSFNDNLNVIGVRVVSFLFFNSCVIGPQRYVSNTSSKNYGFFTHIYTLLQFERVSF